jgi:vancomycin permeability regulator SanA
VLVLLGTDEFVQGTTEPSGTFRPRIAAAAELARSGRVKLVVTSGTDVHARAMADRLREAGVTCPIVEDPYGLAHLGFRCSGQRHTTRTMTSCLSRKVGIACAPCGRPIASG